MKASIPNHVVRYEEASRIIRVHADALAKIPPPDAQRVALLASLGRVLAEPILADRDQPPFARSTRDGFACRAAALTEGPLPVVGLIRAGDPEELEHSNHPAVEIMTGAAVPAAFDCVVMIEHVVFDEGTIRLSPGRTIAAGQNIVSRGAEALAGAEVLPRGTRIGPSHIAAAASCGADRLAVFPRPRIAIVATGDELVELDQPPLTHQIRNSNSYSLAAQVIAGGAEPIRLPTARDERAHLQNVIHSALDADLLLLSGGVSMGKYDLVEEVLLELGAEFFFTGALIQPGKPVVFGKLSQTDRPLYFFGLPGNPVSTTVTFSLFVEPLLGALCGELRREPRFAQATLAAEWRGKSGLTRFLPALVAGSKVQSIAWQGSGDLASSSRANCFLVVPEDRSLLPAGETVTVLLA